MNCGVWSGEGAGAGAGGTSAKGLGTERDWRLVRPVTTETGESSSDPGQQQTRHYGGGRDENMHLYTLLTQYSME